MPNASDAAKAARQAVPAASPPVSTADLYRAAWAASLGSALEYCNFPLYNLASALIFGPLFFPSQDPAMGPR